MKSQQLRDLVFTIVQDCIAVHERLAHKIQAINTFHMFLFRTVNILIKQ